MSPSSDVPWAKVTVTPEAVEKMSELAAENKRLRVERDNCVGLAWHNEVTTRLREERDRLRSALSVALRYVSCCGYRAENESAYPHVTGCPLGQALEGSSE